ncbi:amidohydrolase family protein [Dokdonella sp. MW10]|uniref:amidohydrolase family protein n=1 Tax=Dokdonella sp. MW10 TaxID=2992926 RepID=UPI003F7D6FAE
MRTTRLVLALLSGLAAFGASAAERVEKSKALLLGQPAGSSEARYADDGSLVARYEYNDRGRGPKLETTLRIGADGIPLSSRATGNDYFKGAVEETFSRDGARYRWKNNAEDETRELAAPAFYLPLNMQPEEAVVLVRALLKAPGGKLALLPAGEARIEKVATEKVKGKGTVTLYMLSGLGLQPEYVWLDADQRFFASWSSWMSFVREGHEGALARLGERQDKEEKRLARERAASLTRTLAKPLLIRDVRVFDPPSGEVVDGRSVLIDKGRIVSIDAADRALPAGAEVLEGGGRFLMPGLWDMHTHYSAGADGPLNLGSGVTTIRDLANNLEALKGRIDAIEAGADLGPRIIRAGVIDGRGPYAGPIKTLADNEKEAVDAVAMYAASGHEQIKIYSSIKPELMPVIARAAHEKGLRVSGHVPAFMTARQFVEGGADEIQHINMLVLNFLFDIVQDTRSPARFTAVAQHAAKLDLGSAPVREFIGLLKARDIVVDPTVGTFEDMFLGRPGVPGPGMSAIIDRFPPTVQRSMRSGSGGLPIAPGSEALYRDSYQRLVDYVGVLYRSGVRIVPGTDNLAGMTLPRELELYVEAGIPPKDVLRIATHDSAKVMKREAEYGRVAPGYVSDLILVDGDPTVVMADIRKVATTIRGDRLYDADALFRSVGVQPAPR